MSDHARSHSKSNILAQHQDELQAFLSAAAAAAGPKLGAWLHQAISQPGAAVTRGQPVPQSARPAMRPTIQTPPTPRAKDDSYGQNAPSSSSYSRPPNCQQQFRGNPVTQPGQVGQVGQVGQAPGHSSSSSSSPYGGRFAQQGPQEGGTPRWAGSPSPDSHVSSGCSSSSGRYVSRPLHPPATAAESQMPAVFPGQQHQGQQQNLQRCVFGPSQQGTPREFLGGPADSREQSFSPRVAAAVAAAMQHPDAGQQQQQQQQKQQQCVGSRAQGVQRVIQSAGAPNSSSRDPPRGYLAEAGHYSQY